MSLVDEQPCTRVVTTASRLAPPRRSRRWLALPIVLVVAVLAILALGLRDHRTPQTRPPAPAQGQPLSHTADGAARAAVTYAATYGSADMFQSAKRHQIVGAIADPSVEHQLQSQLDQAFSAVLGTFGLDEQGRSPAGETFVARTIPVGVHVEQYDGNTAVVAVWSTGLVGLAGSSSTKPVTEAWSTATLTLHWRAGEWKWVGFSQVDGPTPVTGTQPASGGDAIATAARVFGEPAYAR